MRKMWINKQGCLRTEEYGKRARAAQEGKVIYYLNQTRTESGYTTTYVDIWLCGAKLPTLDYLIEGCVDNRAGYENQRVADALREAFKGAKATGFTRADTSMVARAAKAAVSFQWYDQGVLDPDDRYCEPHFDFGHELPRIEGGLKLVKRIERQWRRRFPGARPFTNPEDLVEVLRRLRAVELVHWEYKYDGSAGFSGSTLLYCSAEKLSRSRRPSVHDMETVIPQGNHNGV